MMKRSAVLGMMGMLSVFLCAGGAFAEPHDGYGLSGGLAVQEIDGTFKPPLSGRIEYSGIGLSIGFDYQFVLSPDFSLNPFLMSSSESVSSDDLIATDAGHGILGIQGRYWFANDFFVGVHIGSYSEVLSVGSSSVSATGFGYGIAAGWENPDGGLTVAGQMDSVPIRYADSDVDLTGFRLSVGYRWK